MSALLTSISETFLVFLSVILIFSLKASKYPTTGHGKVVSLVSNGLINPKEYPSSTIIISLSNIQGILAYSVGIISLPVFLEYCLIFFLPVKWATNSSLFLKKNVFKVWSSNLCMSIIAFLSLSSWTIPCCSTAANSYSPSLSNLKFWKWLGPKPVSSFLKSAELTKSLYVKRTPLVSLAWTNTPGLVSSLVSFLFKSLIT